MVDFKARDQTELRVGVRKLRPTVAWLKATLGYCITQQDYTGCHSNPWPSLGLNIYCSALFPRHPGSITY